MHDTALELAERVGFLVRNNGVLRRLDGRPGLTVRGSRIHPGRKRMAQFLSTHRARHNDPPTHPNAPPTLFVSDRPLHLVDDDLKSLRPFTTQDVIDGAKLVEMLRDKGVNGGVTGLPSDVPARLAPFEQILIALRYGRNGGYSSHGFTLWHARYMEQIARALGQPYALGVWTPSPFRLEGNELEIVLAMEGAFTSLGVGSMPLMGITAPMSEQETWIQALAETIGAATILSEMYPGVPVDFWPHPKSADLSTGGYGAGSPEWSLLDALKYEILPFYGLRPPWGRCTSEGPAVPGAQAQMERTAAYLSGYLQGYRFFDAGSLAGGDVFSPVQLFYDIETVQWCERYARGIAWRDRIEGLDRWAEIASSDRLFAEDPAEVARMRQTYWTPRFFKPSTAGQYIAIMPDAARDALAEARRLIAAHQYEPDWKKLQEVQKIVDHARQNA